MTALNTPIRSFAKKPVVVKKSEVDPEPDVVLAAQIRAISDGVTQLMQGPLRERAILVLLHDATGVPRGTIKTVLDGLQSLKSAYLKG